MNKIFQRLIENQFSELTGLTVDASIPFSERLINELIEVQLQGNKNISHCRVSVGRQNRLDVQLKTSLWPWPLSLKVKLFGAVDVTGSPVIRGFLENKVLLARLGSLLKALPPGITIYENQISVDVGSFIEDDEQKRFLHLIKAVEIRTEEGKLILDVRIEK